MASTTPSDTVRGGAGRKTTTSRAFDAQLAVNAPELHGVFLLDELCALGLSASAIRRRARVGRLHRVHHRVYSLLPVPLLTVNGRYRAAAWGSGNPWNRSTHSSIPETASLRFARTSSGVIG